MVLIGLKQVTPEIIFSDSISSGHTIPLNGFGFRLSISTAINGDDTWPGTATSIPIPPDIGEQMQIISTSASDSSAGIGARSIQIHYIDNSGNPLEETVTTNGTTPVLTIATNIRFIQDIHVITAGSNLLTVGTITIASSITPTNIYNQIQPGTNQSLNTSRMVPNGKILLITQFNASGGAASGGRSADIRLRTTSHHGILTPRLFHFVDNFFAFNSGTSRRYDYPIIVPAFGIIKCTSYTSLTGADVQASWQGILIDTPI